MNLIGTRTEWRASTTVHMYEGRDRATNEVKWSATAVDLVFGANPSFGSSRSFMPAATEGDVRA